MTCAPERLPTEPKRISPGLDRARAISSLTVVAGSEGCATRMKSDVETRLMAAKSRSVSYGTLGCRVGHRVGAGSPHQQGIAVGGRLRHELGADAAAGTRPVFHDDPPARIFAERLRHDTRGHVRPGAGRARHDQPDRPGGKGLRARRDREQCPRRRYSKHCKCDDGRLHFACSPGCCLISRHCGPGATRSDGGINVGNGDSGHFLLRDRLSWPGAGRQNQARVTTGASSAEGSGWVSARISSAGGSSGSSVAVSVATRSCARKPPDWCRHSFA